MLEALQNETPTKPIAFLPQSNPAEILLYEIAVYVMHGAEEPESTVPAVRRVVHRLHQAVSDNPVVCPYANAQQMPPMPPMPRPEHQMLGPLDAALHGRPVIPPPPPP